jgi:hypothetical protein
MVAENIGSIVGMLIIVILLVCLWIEVYKKPWW